MAVVPALIAAFGLWSLVSALWSLDAHVSLLDSQRTLLYLAAACCFALAGPGLAAGVVGGATVVAVWALGGRLLNGAHVDPYEGKLLVGPIGYANGLGGLDGDRRRGRRRARAARAPRVRAAARRAAAGAPAHEQPWGRGGARRRLLSSPSLPRLAGAVVALSALALVRSSRLRSVRPREPRRLLARRARDGDRAPARRRRAPGRSTSSTTASRRRTTRTASICRRSPSSASSACCSSSRS